MVRPDRPTVAYLIHLPIENYECSSLECGRYFHRSFSRMAIQDGGIPPSGSHIAIEVVGWVDVPYVGRNLVDVWVL